MADSKFTSQQGCFKDAVNINSERIYDSCCDKDCLEDLYVHFTPLNQTIINNASSIKCKCVEVITVFLDVEPVPFNKGFYSVDMEFYFLVKLEAVVSPLTPPVKVDGVATFNKKVILYGSEGNVSTFNSERIKINDYKVCCCDDTNLPKATISVVKPICLSYRLEDVCCPAEVKFVCPKNVAEFFDDEFDTCIPKKNVFVSIGVFSIVQLQRAIQMLIPVYDYSMPTKECTSENGNDDPCEIFKKIKFPVNEFFPPKLSGNSEEC